MLQLPHHDRSSTYARSGLFKGLESFADLESRIEQLPTEQERGAAFEVFVEAYLNTDEMAQAEEVWVVGRVPAEVRRRLNLPAKDYGYDGVFRTKLDELVPYQAKFRSGRTSLPYAELATFFGISEKADRRVVLTNSIAISEVAESRTAFQTTRGGDFDRLDAAQLAVIAAWVEGIPLAPEIRKPRPHQKAALADIEREFSGHDRATVVMACGTGKTLVALWACDYTRRTQNRPGPQAKSHASAWTHGVATRLALESPLLRSVATPGSGARLSENERRSHWKRCGRFAFGAPRN